MSLQLASLVVGVDVLTTLFGSQTSGAAVSHVASAIPCLRSSPAGGIKKTLSPLNHFSSLFEFTFFKFSLLPVFVCNFGRYLLMCLFPFFKFFVSSFFSFVNFLLKLLFSLFDE